ncbi:exported hypothetical protein [Candidatus Sulfotelmatomonas gaucii]|uniref:Uncharacterized protein n=1 Tax=Candidatus Sulfuritelmatomonas gaucii TaxID=2043161 RepID=A0A2N9L202_9BACT|nr:exported hypothetical protein [Candidatus Sulfotelmatomonas gaucii]
MPVTAVSRPARRFPVISSAPLAARVLAAAILIQFADFSLSAGVAPTESFAPLVSGTTTITPPSAFDAKARQRGKQIAYKVCLTCEFQFDSSYMIVAKAGPREPLIILIQIDFA